MITTSLTPITIICPSPSFNYIALAVGYEIQLVTPTVTLFLPLKHTVNHLSWSPDEQYLAGCTYGGEYAVWDIHSLNIVSFRLSLSRYTQIQFSSLPLTTYELNKKGTF